MTFQTAEAKATMVLQMSTQESGVQGLIAKKNPKALYVHCNSHVLNLVIVKSCSLPSVRNMAGTITEISKFFQLFSKVAEMLTESNQH